MDFGICYGFIVELNRSKFGLGGLRCRDERAG